MQEHESEENEDASDPIAYSPLAYSPQGAAEASSLSLRQVMKAIRSGTLPSFKKGRRRIIFREDLEAYLKSE